MLKVCAPNAWFGHCFEEAMMKDALERASEPNLNLKTFLQHAYLHPVLPDHEDDDDVCENWEDESVLVPAKRSSRKNTPLPSGISATSSAPLPEVHEDSRP